MKKIPTVFERDWEGDRSRVIDKVHSGCEWVLAGEGWATQKIDGSCCLVRDGKLFKRREIKEGQAIPPDFEAVDSDDETHKTVGWVPVGDGPEDRYHREAFGDYAKRDGTYELVGPKVQGNPEGWSRHTLLRHGTFLFGDGIAETEGGERPPGRGEPPRTFDGLRVWLTKNNDMEGIVFRHPDGRMAKIKLKDFGIKRGTIG